MEYLNVAVVEWIVQYRIRDAKAYLFHVRDVPETFRYMSEASMRQVVGDHSVDEVITIGREAIALQAKEELQRLCNMYGIGIEIQQLVLQDVNPPDPVTSRTPVTLSQAALTGLRRSSSRSMRRAGRKAAGRRKERVNQERKGNMTRLEGEGRAGAKRHAPAVPARGQPR